LWMMPRDPDADMCRGVLLALQSTEECMALQSYVRRQRVPDMSRLMVRAISRQSALSRATARLPAINRWRKIWRRKARDDAQLGGQDKRGSLRLPLAVGLALFAKILAQAAFFERSLSI